MKKEVFECGKCKEKFNKKQQLGGHMSRAHPGESETYLAKQRKRKERENERYILELARKKFYQKYGQNS